MRDTTPNRTALDILLENARARVTPQLRNGQYLHGWLSQRTGIPINTMRRYVQRETVPGIDACEAIARAIGMQLHDATNPKLIGCEKVPVTLPVNGLIYPGEGWKPRKTPEVTHIAELGMRTGGNCLVAPLCQPLPGDFVPLQQINISPTPLQTYPGCLHVVSWDDGWAQQCAEVFPRLGFETQTFHDVEPLLGQIKAGSQQLVIIDGSPQFGDKLGLNMTKAVNRLRVKAGSPVPVLFAARGHAIHGSRVADLEFLQFAVPRDLDTLATIVLQLLGAARLSDWLTQARQDIPTESL